MSEYNVFVTEQGVVVFDWPQAVPTDHENAREFLERDVQNVVGYFGRKYPGHVGDPDVPGLADTVAAGALEDVSEFLE
jgi:RIO kinase 2